MVQIAAATFQSPGQTAQTVQVVQRNLPRYTDPMVLASYKPRQHQRPGGIHEWAAFTSRLSEACDQLYQDARQIVGRRNAALEARPGSTEQRDAARAFHALLRRATEHCQTIAYTLLATGLSREHIDHHLALCGMERGSKPDYGIALLYSKLMGIPFREERSRTATDASGRTRVETMAEERMFTWAKEIRPSEVDDFYRTMRALQETLPHLSAKFHRVQAARMQNRWT